MSCTYKQFIISALLSHGLTFAKLYDFIYPSVHTVMDLGRSIRSHWFTTCYGLHQKTWLVNSAT